MERPNLVGSSSSRYPD